jgi:hypothetical protein
MFSTADVFFTFSSFFHDKYRANEISPLNFIDIGYIYDRSFKLLRKKVNNIPNLDKKFVIGYKFTQRYSAMQPITVRI